MLRGAVGLVRRPAALAERCPWETAGFALARIVLSLPVLYLLARPLVPVAATLVVAARAPKHPTSGNRAGGCAGAGGRGGVSPPGVDNVGRIVQAALSKRRVRGREQRDDPAVVAVERDERARIQRDSASCRGALPSLAAGPQHRVRPGALAPGQRSTRLLDGLGEHVRPPRYVRQRDGHRVLHEAGDVPRLAGSDERPDGSDLLILERDRDLEVAIPDTMLPAGATRK
jgi:hypothetical protein